MIASSGGTWGGERVTVQGSGFTTGCTVDFGSVRAAGTQVLDPNTLVTIVPQPASASSTAATDVDVTVTPTTGTGATLTAGYRYAMDETRFVVGSTFPAQGATAVPRNLRSSVVLLTAPADTSTAAYGTVTGTNTFWFEAGGAFTTGGVRGFGPGGRFLVISRTTTGNLPLVNLGMYVLDVPVALQSTAGSALEPVRLDPSLNHDQYTFTISTTATDTTAPTLSAISPANAATGVDPMAEVVLTFSEEIDPLTVTATTFLLSQGATGVPVSLSMDDDLRKVRLRPHVELGASVTYTVTVTAGVADLCGNALTALTRTFTTVGTTDTTSPTIDSVVVEHLPSSVDGSGTYVNTAGVTGQAFDVFLPRNGWLLELAWSDAGGAGIDDTTFSATCSVAVGSRTAGTQLASLFTTTPTGASWRIATGDAVTAGENVTFTFTIRDRQSNLSSSRTITVDVVNKDAVATNGSDHDPLDSRATWILRTDLDAYAASYASTTSPTVQQGATTTVASNGMRDLDEALRLVGLGTASMTAAAQATTNGADVGTNAIVRRLFLERTRELLNERFGIDADGTHRAESVNVEFLLPGEQGSLGSMPAYSTANSSNSSYGYSEISLGGTNGAESGAYTASGTIAQAWYDARNLRREANLNTGSGTLGGVYLLGMFKLQVNSNALFKARISNKFVTVHGGTPVGEDASDDDVLADTFSRTTSTDATKNARYDAIMDAVEHLALYVSAVAAHEVGHSLGLVPDGPPKTGLFGNAHWSNSFTEATSTVPNTSKHLDFVGNDLMSAATTFNSTTWTGTDFKRFSPMDIAFLLNNVLHDEGR